METPKEKKKPMTRTEINRRWNEQNLEQVNFSVQKGEKAVIAAAAEKAGLSMRAFIKEAIDEKIERNEVPEK